ncbi:MAG: TonB-dependent receptor [Gammaproteobacteria bacterium]|nr:TonB-dependent receptor [Gammaproteobacteria bacterium]
MNWKQNKCRMAVARALTGLPVLAVGAFGLSSTQAIAGESGGGLEEIIVTAQFRSENLQETPIAITAVTGEMLDARNARDIADASNWAPNVQLSRGAAGFGQMASIFIRGVGQADPHFAVEPGVGMYLDDVYYGVLTGALFDLVDTDRVEVLRGPQGTLAGKNSIGGSIKLFSKRPGPEADAFAEFQVGTFNRISGRAATNITLVEDTLYARVSAMGKHRKGYLDRLDYDCAAGNAGAGSGRLQENCKIGSEGGESTFGGRASVLWLISDRVENTFTFDITSSNSENPAAKQRFESPIWTGTASYLTPEHSYTNFETNVSVPTGAGASSSFVKPSTTPLDAWGVSNHFDFEISDNVRLTSITAYRESKVQFSTALEASPASVSDQIWHLNHTQFTQELRLSGEYGMLDWTLGGFYYDADGRSGGRVNIPGGLAVGGGGLNLDILFEDPVKTSSKSVFAHLVLHPVENLSLTAAVRYTDDSKDFTFNRWDYTGAPHPVLGALVDFTVPYSGDNVDFRFAADYQLSDALMIYGSFSTGYKGGGVNPRPFFTSQAIPYNPETLDAIEFGFKSQLFDNRVRLNAAAFYNDFTDLQGTLIQCDAFSPFPGAPCAMSANVGDAHIKGFEVEVEMQPVDGMLIDVALGVVDFNYTRVDPATAITEDQVLHRRPV